MSHLSLETIARLVEDAPASEEAAHLESCAECRAELAAMTEDVHALSLLPDMAAAPDDWESLERRLIDEGLIRTPARRYGGRGMRMLQIAAALTLFVGGSLAGRMTARPEIVTVRAPDVPVTGSEAPPQGALVVESPEQVIAAPVVDRPVRGNPDVTLAANGFGREPRTVEEAALLLRETEELYLTALTRYAEMTSQSEPGDPVARLAAWQSITQTTQAALNQTPTDPVINGYHLTALAQRDATLRQVAAASNERWY